MTDDLGNSASSSSGVVHPGLSAKREGFVVVLIIATFGGVGVWRYFVGDGSGFLFLMLAALVSALFLYGLFRKRSVDPEGPSDPAKQWRPDAGTADGVERIFRYSSASIWSVRIVALLSLLLGPAVYFLSSPRPSGSELYVMASICTLFSGAFFLGVKACDRFGIEVTRTGIVHHRLRSPLTYSFQTLGSIALLEGGGRGPSYVLALYDPHGRRVDQFPSTLDGFEELVALVKKRALEFGLKYRYRDMWGCWTT